MDGIINVRKEKGFTSFDVVAKLRGILKMKKIGHTGTLDPDAEGVLPVCIGKATRVCDLLTDKDKVYEAVMLLGKETDTQDMTGTILKESEVNFSIEEVKQCIESFVGEYAQIPPMYSALKVGGKKLYELAREGKTVERKARNVMIHSIKILCVDLPRVEMEVSCSIGTYIRTLCHDIGEKLGVGGCMESLLRVQVGRFVLADSLRLSEIQKAKEDGNLEKILQSIDSVFEQYRAVWIRPDQEKRLQNGNSFRKPDRSQNYDDQEMVRVYDSNGHFAAVYRYVEKDHEFRIVKMFLQP